MNHLDIQCCELIKTYHGRQALDGISVTFDHAAITGLLGVNGAGKSTLIKSILHLIQLDTGKIIYPENVTVGYLPEMAQLPLSATAWQVVLFAAQLRKNTNTDNATRDAAIALLLARVQLQRQYWHKPLRHFSKGMRQRVALAYAIATQPEWLILDEPMSGLDAMGRKQFLEIIQEVHSGGAGVLVCSHIVPDLVRLCDSILLMYDGKIVDEIVLQDHSMEEARVVEERLVNVAECDDG